MERFAREVDVVLVDDEPRLLAVQHRLFEACGFRVRAFRCPAGALEAIEQAPPWILVTDLSMPRMDGAALAAQVHERLPEALRPRLVLASGSTDALPRWAQRLFDLVLSKPVDWTAVAPTLRSWLPGRPETEHPPPS